MNLEAESTPADFLNNDLSELQYEVIIEEQGKVVASKLAYEGKSKEKEQQLDQPLIPTQLVFKKNRPKSFQIIDQTVKDTKFRIKVADWPNLLEAGGWHIPPPCTTNFRFIRQLLND